MTYVTAAVIGLSELSVNVCSEPKLRASAARLKLIHTATPDTTRLSRRPVDRRRDAGQVGSYA